MRGRVLLSMSQNQKLEDKNILGEKKQIIFSKNIGMETNDAIQQFNKTTGIKRIKMRGYYCLEYPF